jgi:hypothetical protein
MVHDVKNPLKLHLSPSACLLLYKKDIDMEYVLQGQQICETKLLHFDTSYLKTKGKYTKHLFILVVFFVLKFLY